MRLVVVVGFVATQHNSCCWTMMEQRIIVFAVVPRTNFSSRVVVVVVVLGGLQSAFTLYLTKKREISIKRYPVVFRVLKKTLNMWRVFLLFFFFFSLELKKFLLRFETQKKKPPTSNGVLDVREETETGDRAGPVGAESRRCQFKRRRRRRSTRQKSEGHKTAQY